MLKKNAAIFHYYYNNNLMLIFFPKSTRVRYSFKLKNLKIRSANDVIYLANNNRFDFYNKTATKKEFKDVINTFDILVLAVKYTINADYLGVANLNRNIFQHIPQLVLFSALMMSYTNINLK